MALLKIATYSAPCVVLGKDRLWWIFLLSSICTPFILVILVVFARAIIWLDAKRRNRLPPQIGNVIYGLRVELEVPWISALRDAADVFVSVRFRLGQIMAALAFIFSMCSLFIYYNTVSFFIRDVEHCQPWVNNIGQQVDFAFNCFFLVYFVLRFTASEDKISMIFNIYSIIDYFTVPPAFVGIGLDRDWVGLKFLRVIYLRRVSAILASFGIMTSTPKIKLTQLGLTWIAILLAAGGLFHLVENAGDPFKPEYNGQRVTYWDFCYFAFGTMATLGSADVNVTTVLGKLTNCFLVMIVLAVIALALPDVSDLLGKRRKYDGEHRRVHNERHVVICGDVSHDSVVAFFHEFFHPDRDITNIKIIVLGAPEPDMEFAAWLKKNMYQIGYLQGSLLNARDLYRSKLHEADACLILADKATSNADAEDSNNIMRVVALKNYHPTVRVIVQLLQYRSKSYLTSIPNWNPSVGDDVICLPELKLGLIAQSCIAPGFSTLMANMFAARSSDTRDWYPQWMNEYLEGAGKEMYTVQLSDSFEGATFMDTVETCYNKLNILFFAVSTEALDSEASFFNQSFVVNPVSSYVIRAGMSGCFIADSAKDAQIVSFYCKLCHEDVSDPALIKPCACEKSRDVEVKEEAKQIKQEEKKRNGRRRMSKKLPSRKEFRKASAKKDKTSGIETFQMTMPTVGDLLDSAVIRVANTMEVVANRVENALGNEDTDSQARLEVGSVGVSSDILSDSIRSDDEELREKVFSSFEMKIMYFMRNFGSLTHWRQKNGEIVYDDEGRRIILSDAPRFDSTGMFWWCPPKQYEEVLMDRYQASKIKFKNHVVLIVFSHERSSVVGLNNFVMPLRSSSATYDELRDIVILGDPRFLSLEWQWLMNFPKIYLVKIFALSRADLRAVDIHLADMVLLMTAAAGQDTQDTLLSDKDPILTCLTIKAMNFGVYEELFDDKPIVATSLAPPRSNGQLGHLRSSVSVSSSLKNEVSRTDVVVPRPNTPQKQSVIRGYSVPLLIELINDSNVQFVDQDDVDINQFFMAEPFTCGNAFATSVLQSLLVSTYFNPFTLGILRLLIFGGITPEFEQILSEGAGLIGGPNLSQKQPHTDRCVLNQIDVQDVRFVRHVHGKYADLFLDGLLHHNILVLGLYRLIAPGTKGPRSLRRYVMTNPPRDIEIYSDDKIFIIERSRQQRYSW